MRNLAAAICLFFLSCQSLSAQQWFDIPIGGGATIIKNNHAWGFCATGAARFEFAALDPVVLAASFYPSLGLSTDANYRLCYEWPLVVEAHFRLGRQTDSTAELGIFAGLGFSHSRLGSEANIFFVEPIKNTGLYIDAGIRSNQLTQKPLELRISVSPNFVRTGHSVIGAGLVYWFMDDE